MDFSADGPAGYHAGAEDHSGDQPGTATPIGAQGGGGDGEESDGLPDLDSEGLLSEAEVVSADPTPAEAAAMEAAAARRAASLAAAAGVELTFGAPAAGRRRAARAAAAAPAAGVYVTTTPPPLRGSVLDQLGGRSNALAPPLRTPAPSEPAGEGALSAGSGAAEAAAASSGAAAAATAPPGDVQAPGQAESEFADDQSRPLRPV